MFALLAYNYSRVFIKYENSVKRNNKNIVNKNPKISEKIVFMIEEKNLFNRLQEMFLASMKRRIKSAKRKKRWATGSDK